MQRNLLLCWRDAKRMTKEKCCYYDDYDYQYLWKVKTAVFNHCGKVEWSNVLIVLQANILPRCLCILLLYKYNHYFNYSYYSRFKEIEDLKLMYIHFARSGLAYQRKAECLEAILIFVFYVEMSIKIFFASVLTAHLIALTFHNVFIYFLFDLVIKFV